MIKMIQSGILSTVFEIIGITFPVVLGLIVYVGIELKNNSLDPPSAACRETS
jgi:hypothetical protein